MTATDDKVLNAVRLHRTTLGLDKDGLLLIAKHAKLEEIAAGDILHQAGKPADGIVLIVKGSLRLEIPNANKGAQVIRVLSRGSQFGLLGLGKDVLLPVSLVAAADSQILRIPTEAAIYLMKYLPLWDRQLADSIGGWQSAKPSGDRPSLQFVAMVHMSPDSRLITRRITDRLAQLGEKVTVFTDNADSFRGAAASVNSVLDRNGELQDVEEIQSRVAQCRDYDRVLLSFDAQSAEPNLGLLTNACDRAYWFAKPEQAGELEQQLATITAGNESLIENMRCVWCLDPQEPVAPLTSGVLDRVGRDIKLRLPQVTTKLTRLEERGFVHLLHDLRGVRLGIALSGGAARCMAHIGVLQALENAGIVIDAISGTSAGAMVGALYAAGMPPEEASQNFARDLQPGRVESRVPRGELLYLLKKYRRNEWDGMLRAYLHDWQLQQLLTPVTTVSVDLVSGSPQIEDRGDAVQAILESINLPGLSPPICRDAMALVDGGVLNNLPADVLVNRGADFVIAVDVGSQLPHEFSRLRSDASAKKVRPPNAFDTLLRAMSVQSHRMNALGAQPADFRIEPDVSEFALSDFCSAVEIARVGQEATEQEISALCQALKKVDPCLVATL